MDMTLVEAKEIASVLRKLGFRAKGGIADTFLNNGDIKALVRVRFADETRYLTIAEADWFRFGFQWGRSTRKRNKK